MTTQTILATYSALKTERSHWDTWWQQLRHYVLPRRTQTQEGIPLGNSAPDENLDNIYDTTAIEACQKLASGHIAYITPAHEVWFRWTPPPELADNDNVISWYNQASEIAFRELGNSNFYTEIHETFLDRSALGTGSLFCGLNSEGSLTFTHIPCGSFACAENEEGRVDTYYREFIFTPYQAERQFGREKLGKRCQALLDSAHKKHTGTLRFLHVVYPRSPHEYDPLKKDAANRPFRSVYISMDDHNIVEEDGYHDFPYLVTRFLKWGEGPYGLPPGRLVFPAIKQAQFLNRILDTLGEIAAFPRILELANQVGEIDFRAGGRTVISPEAAQLGYPREWATNGNYSIGLERLKSKQEAIRQGFFLPMFEFWGTYSHRMTATEVTARENEKALLFSPSFTLFITDFQPIMNRIFGLLYRQGKFPPPPQEIFSYSPHSGTKIIEPTIVYQSKIALILRRLQSENFDRSLSRLKYILPHHPQAGENFNWDNIIRDTTRYEGVPEHFLVPLDKLKEQRDQQKQQAMMPLPESNLTELPPSLENTALTLDSINNQETTLESLLNTPLNDEQLTKLLPFLTA